MTAHPHSFLRSLFPLAVASSALLSACFAEHTVGSDVDSGAAQGQHGDGGGGGGDSSACAQPNVPCNEPNIPPGCTLGQPSCVDGVYTCPPIVCGDADTCPQPNVPCGEPNIPPGCTLGQPSCANGVYTCPPVVCSDGGTCAPNPVCAGANIPPGCTLGQATCDNGVYTCPPVICPPDAGSFACGSLTCDGTHQYCQVTEGGPMTPDGGFPVHYACNEIPPACLATANATCACIAPAANGAAMCSETGGDVTVTLLAP